MRKIWDTTLFNQILKDKIQEAVEETLEIIDESELYEDNQVGTRRVVRKGCFETNSSSMHSILITKNDTHVTNRDLTADYNDADYNQQEHIYVDDSGEIWLYGVDDGFGRYPFKFLTSFEQKLMYAMCEFLGSKYEDDDDYDEIYQQFIDITKELIPNFERFDIKKKDFDIYVDVDGNELKHRQLKYDHWDHKNRRSVYTYTAPDGTTQLATLSDEVYEVPDIGMIDHQSVGLLTNFLKEKNISLKEFLTNKRYVVVIDGDEYCQLENMIKNNLLNNGFVESIYTTGGEDIEYQQWLKEQKDNEESNS